MTISALNSFCFSDPHDMHVIAIFSPAAKLSAAVLLREGAVLVYAAQIVILSQYGMENRSSAYLVVNLP